MLDVSEKSHLKAGESANAELCDTQNEADDRGVRIDKVGVRGLRQPLRIRDKDGVEQASVATIGLFVDLPAELRGTHMSRFVEALNEDGGTLGVGDMSQFLQSLRRRLNADSAHIELEFPWFSTKKAPVTGKESLMDYTVRISANAIGEDVDLVLAIEVGVTTLCPCSKAISQYGAHNQRGKVTAQIRSRETIWITDLIGLVEGCASSELYALLKRPDEKAVTERAYENPVFVEDLVRNVALKLKAQPDITWHKVEAENFESIHSHNAYACIETG